MKKLVSVLLTATLLFASATALAEKKEYHFVVSNGEKEIGAAAEKGDSEQRYYVTQYTSLPLKTYYGVRTMSDHYTNIANPITVEANTSNVKHNRSYKITVYAKTQYRLASEIQEGIIWDDEAASYFGVWNP